MGRTPCCAKVGMRKGRWTAEEDDILTKYIQANGEGSWRSLPKNAGLLRCGKSCRLRWINYLRADLKRGNISAEEEDIIVKLHASFGNRWSLIASHLQGRTDNEIKNYWNSHLSRKIYCFRRTATSDMDPTPKVPIPPKRKGGRTSRWAMKKNKTYSRKGTTHNTEQRVTQQNNNNNNDNNNNDDDDDNDEAAVPQPPTPSLESEGLCNPIEDFMQLDLDIEDMIIKGVEVADEPSSLQETAHEVEELRRLKTTHVDGEKRVSDDMLGPYEPEGINGGGGALSFSDNDITETCVSEAWGVSNLRKERENNDVLGVSEDNVLHDVMCPNKMIAASEDPESTSLNLSSTGESGGWYPWSPLALGLDDIWDWESAIEMNDHNDNESEAQEEHKENLLTWLWEDDDWEGDCMKLGQIDLQRQNDMVDWFLS